ncbi:MAG TPA: hypothetical protein VEZ71_03615 [Archangium sp.]|nr:hypothetical protein [Archangium sp.]
MSHELVHARVLEHLERLRLGHLAQRMDALLAEAARGVNARRAPWSRSLTTSAGHEGALTAMR